MLRIAVAIIARIIAQGTVAVVPVIAPHLALAFVVTMVEGRGDLGHGGIVHLGYRSTLVARSAVRSTSVIPRRRISTVLLDIPYTVDLLDRSAVISMAVGAVKIVAVPRGRTVTLLIMTAPA
jgi:hypothetical protein